MINYIILLILFHLFMTHKFISLMNLFLEEFLNKQIIYEFISWLLQFLKFINI